MLREGSLTRILLSKNESTPSCKPVKITFIRHLPFESQLSQYFFPEHPDLLVSEFLSLHSRGLKAAMNHPIYLWM